MNDQVFSLLKKQINGLNKLPFYADKLAKVGMRPEDLKDPEDFSKIPFTTGAEMSAELKKKPAECCFYSEAVRRINFSPSGKDLYPVYNTENDLAKMHEVSARTLKDAGVTPGDICAVTFGYHLFIAGLLYQSQLEYYGAKAIPLGPGESERAISLINQCEVSVLITNPTFAIRLAQGGIPSVRILFVGGEPFSSVEGYPEKVRAAFKRDITIIDSYSMALCMPIARNCRHNPGLHVVDDFVYAEVIDPATGEEVPLGEKGELVLTHLQKEAAPLLRYRTGDLTMMVKETCPCGRQYTLPKSVFGRTDEMLKIKGVKFWPSQIRTVLHGFAEFSPNYRVIVSEEKGTDRLRLVVEGGQKAQGKVEALAQSLKKDTLLNFNQIEVVEKLEPGPAVVDQRKGRSF